MELGLEALTVEAGYETPAEFMSAYMLMMDDVIDESALHDEEAARDASLCNLINLRATLGACPNPAAALEFLCSDANFALLVGADMRIENLDKAIDASVEHLLQDFLRWGPIGMIAGTYLASLGRISSVLNSGIDAGVSAEKMASWSGRSVYLPSYEQFTKMMKGLKLLQTSCVQLVKNPKEDLVKIVEALRACGIDASASGNINKKITTDWKAVAGDWIGNICLGLPGKIIGTHMLSNNGGTLSTRGWTPTNFIQGCKDMRSLVDNIKKLEDSKDTMIAKNPDNAAKLLFVKKAYSVYLHTVKNVGRGLASALYHIKN